MRSAAPVPEDGGHDENQGESDGNRAEAGHKLGFWVRIVVSVVLLAILVSNVPDLDGIVPARDHRRTLTLLAAAVAMTFLGVALSAWRWQRVLAAYHARVGLVPLTSHYLAGLFVGNVLPSTIGGDVLRVARGSKSTGSTEVAFGSVVLERLTGFFALPLLVAIGFVAMPSLLDHERSWLMLIIGGVTLGILGVILTLAGSPRMAGRFREHENWMRFIAAIHVGVDRIRAEPIHALYVLGTAVIYQFSVVLTVVLIAAALDLGVPFAAFLVVVPVVSMVQVLPLSISGLGVREGMLVLLLVPLGVSSGQAIALGLLWYATNLGVSFLGAPAFAVGHRHRSEAKAPPWAELRAAVDEVGLATSIDLDALPVLDDDGRLTSEPSFYEPGDAETSEIETSDSETGDIETNELGARSRSADPEGDE